MLSFSPRQRYYLFGTPTNMRKGFSGLGGLVRETPGVRPDARRRVHLHEQAPRPDQTPGVGQNGIRGLVQGARTGHV